MLVNTSQCFNVNKHNLWINNALVNAEININ